MEAAKCSTRAGPRAAVASRHSSAFAIPWAGLGDRSGRFPREIRLRAAEDFQRVLRARRRESGRWFLVCAADSPMGHARLGIVVGRSALALAVLRNRIKRVARERFRQRAERLGPQDIVVRLRVGPTRDEFPAAEAELDRLLQKLER